MNQKSCDKQTAEGKRFSFRTKAETLAFLYRRQEAIGARVLPLRYFTAKAWREDAAAVWQEAEALTDAPRLIVRSSAKGEDAAFGSQAGKFESRVCLREKEAFAAAVREVLASYDGEDGENQFFVQPFLEQADGAGVAFTVDPNSGGNYYVINYDRSGSTSAITAGRKSEGKLFFWFKGSALPEDKMLRKLCEILGRLEKLLGSERLDTEFAFQGQEVILFQARPLFVRQALAEPGAQKAVVSRIVNKIRAANRPQPFLYGTKTLYSNMTDWNPAEMIGVHPRPLALSLYKELITDTTWAYQRDNYGYMRLRSFPLMLDFGGMPYIDVRVSFNSFVPADLPPNVAEKLVNYYLGQLEKHPEEHDKVEFHILFSCYTFDLKKRMQALRQYGFSDAEIGTIGDALRRLTNRIINSKTGLWREDAEKIKILSKRHREIMESGLDEVGKMYWLMEDCKRYGTLPFAGLARAGFIAVQLLQSMMKEHILTHAEYDAFMADVSTVGSMLQRDFRLLPKEVFLRRYGHLRPGTYDISSPRYDERPDIYFRWESSDRREETQTTETFRLSLPQLEHIRMALDEHGLDDDVLGLFAFIKAAIEGRETAKFIFTQNLSETLRLFARWSEMKGVSREEAAFADIQIVKEAYGGTGDEAMLLKRSIETGRKKYQESVALVLPPLITNARDAEEFFVPDSQPTFVTQERGRGEVAVIGRQLQTERLDGKILLIPSADPGFDWIFSHRIAGFVTEYGGANSHMAIRAGELRIPAVIGAGQKLFAQMLQAEMIEIDAALKQVRVLR